VPMRPQLKEFARPAIEDFIRHHVHEAGGNGAVIGLSGGIDSATVSKLCADALGPEKVLNLFLPSASSSDADRRDAEDFCSRFDMPFKVVDIAPVVEAFRSVLSLDRRECAGNVMARCRMIVLYHHAWQMGRVVMGTSNKSELLAGYFTKFGDGGADFCPIGDLYKTEVRQLAREIGVLDTIIDKAPSAGLWIGQTDEGEMGISYDQLDQVLLGLEQSLSNESIAEETGISPDVVSKVWEMHHRTVHKRKMPLIPKLGLRTLGIDWRE
jgi:NAD+ synthase